MEAGLKINLTNYKFQFSSEILFASLVSTLQFIGARKKKT